MTEPLTIACTLDLQALKPRLADIARLTQLHLRSHRLEGRVLQLGYDRVAEEEVNRIVALERECCAFLDFHLRTTGELVELTIIAPEQEGGDSQWLFAQFMPQADTPSLPPSRLPVCGCGGE